MIAVQKVLFALSMFGTLVVAADVVAQKATPDKRTRPNLSGVWSARRCVDGKSDVCPNIRSEAVLTARAKAFVATFDELAVPKYDCVPASPPGLLTDPYPFEIEQAADRVYFRYEKDDVVRTIWLEGHSHPMPKTNEFFVQGHSTGRYEGEQLIVKTSKFSFDPSGIDGDFGNRPSSTQKRMTERYWRKNDLLMVDVTVEDAIFLLVPVKYSLMAQRSAQPLALPWNCDPDAAKENLHFIESKYPQDPPFPPRK